MKVWRICKKKHSSSAFTGSGASLIGGRWNGLGTPIVYTSEHRSLAVLELTVHFDPAVATVPFVVFEVDVPDVLVSDLDVATLPSNWRTVPAPTVLQALGSAWASSKVSAALRVPSAIVPQEWNVLLNPGHPDFEAITYDDGTPLVIDSRLMP